LAEPVRALGGESPFTFVKAAGAVTKDGEEETPKEAIAANSIRNLSDTIEREALFPAPPRTTAVSLQHIRRQISIAISN